MISEPRIVERREQRYVGIRGTVAMGEIGAFIEGSFPELFADLDAQGVEPTGPPFLRYNVIDMDAGLEIEVGVPVEAHIPDHGRVFAAVLPAGRYGTLTYTGEYAGLVDANEALQRWARDEGLEWAWSETDRGDRFESRLEVYLTDPAAEPDPEKWETEVAYLLADVSDPTSH